ncbi:MAG: DUF2634 domain-containing protein [Ruminococcus flavefaciens]|nr:DUF2634 domain-containing protein [Ruminococcus flavefaciens]
MADELFPVFDVPDVNDDEDEFDTEYKRSIRWDPELGDFVRDSSHRLVECDGREAFMVWCLKMVQTERDRHMAYIPEVSGYDMGVEMEEISQEKDIETARSMMQRTITEALLVNPRTEYVKNFVFKEDGDQIHCTFEVKGTDWDDTIRVSI